MKRINDTKHRRIFEKYHGRKIRHGYHIHHIDGNHSNNDPSNLQEVTPFEHYVIHRQQGDWAACILLSKAARVDKKELHELQRLHGKKCTDNKIGIHSEEYDHSAAAREVWKKTPPGRKPVTNGVRVLKFKTNEEVSFFLQKNPDWRPGIPENMKKGLKESTRRLTSSEAKTIAQSRIANKTHNFITHHTCPHCNKTGKGPMMFRWHFDKCKKNGVYNATRI